MNKFTGHEISLFQNFICTKEFRLNLLKKVLPVWADVINPYPVIINYDTDVYADEVRSLYEKYIENLHFQKDLNRDWGAPILDFFSMTDSPYILYLCEDYQFSDKLTRDKFSEIFDEYKENNCGHLMLTRVWKYAEEHWHKNSKRGKNLWLFHSSESPYWQFAAAGLFEREVYKQAVGETIGSGPGMIGIDKLEQSGLSQRDIMCCCLTDILMTHEQPSGTSER